MSTMQAVLFKQEGVVAVEEVPKPEIQSPGDVLLRVDQTMICGTDLHFVHGAIPLDPDFILGHEYLGTVEEKGDGVSEFDVGDKAVGSFMAVCGKCWFCRRGQYPQCYMVRVFGMGSAFGDVAGGQAQYILIPDADFTLRKLPDVDGVADENYAFAGDILTTAYDALMKADFEAGHSVAIVGAGPVGLCTVLLARAMGAGAVVVVDMVDERLRLAEQHGAVGVNPNGGDPEETVKDLTEWRGADIVVDAVGHPSALKATVPLARMGGTITIPGAYTDGDQALEGFGEIYLKGLRLVMGIGNIQGRIDDVMALIRDKRVEPAALISDRMPMSEAVEAYRAFDAREKFKVLLDPAQ
jgi:2-desacetyl-2-hydroxyethyl bacteriochlorophyllide A dehydrogenase